MTVLMKETADLAAWMTAPRFDGIVRLHTAQQVLEQRGTIAIDYPVARGAAAAFYDKLRELFEHRQSVTTFGPYSPGQAVAMKRNGIEGIYLGGWATSAKGSVTEDPGADLASYPLSQVPDEASAIVRALLTADRNQRFARLHMTREQLADNPPVDFRPFIIADADTGHGGEAHVRNLIRRFVEVGVPGYHIEDQKPGVKKCGHQGGKVLVAQNEQVLRLNAARLQLDIMGVAGIIVSRTDAEAASLLESNTDERDQPFILGTTEDVPSYKSIVLAIHRQFFERGVQEIRGQLMFMVSREAQTAADEWLSEAGLIALIDKKVTELTHEGRSVERMLDEVVARALEMWQAQSGLTTYRQAVADVMALLVSEGTPADMTVGDWLEFSKRVSLATARARAESLGIFVEWDGEKARTPEGYYQAQGGLEFAIAKSLASAPFADLLWMETATANLEEARLYAEAIHAVFPDKMLAYNLSPSFNWDTTGMTDEEMQRFPAELAKLGFVFNFITYGGHQIDGLAAEEFSDALRSDGMLALARLQRKLRLRESPYRTPQTLAGGPRMDAALMAASGRTSTTKAMGKGSTQHQHLKQIEPTPRLLDRWLDQISDGAARGRIRARLRPLTDSDACELALLNAANETVASVVFVAMKDRHAGTVLSVREQHLQEDDEAATRRLSLAYLFLLHRYTPASVQVLHPNVAEREYLRELEGMGVLEHVTGETGRYLVGGVNGARVHELATQENCGALVYAGEPVSGRMPVARTA